MFPNLNPKNMEKLMKQFGMKSETIDAKKVIIEMENKKIVFSDPQITKIRISGQEVFQLQGDYSEEASLNEDDIKLVMKKTGCSKDEAERALKETDDIAEAILKLKSK